MRIFTYQCDRIVEDEMSRLGSTHGRDETYIQNFGRKTRREETSWKTYV
jgi:hypothetical protein